MESNSGNNKRTADTARYMAASMPTNNARDEASWVVCLGSRDGKKVYVMRPDHNTRTADLDQAHGWCYKKDAQTELALMERHTATVLGIHTPVGRGVGRRSSFR